VSAACRLDGCTVLETGRCALENETANCPNRIQGVAVPLTPSASTAIVESATATDTTGAAVLPPPDDVPRFPQSAILGLDDIEAIMRSRYVTVVGVLGDPESGKTACLASLYLMLSNARLEGWSYADSRSLMAFEEIARGARRWHKGQPPEQMTVRTEITDDRRPGFLHLRLRRKADGRKVDLALPDLPGEWTKTLIRTADSERLGFFRSADIIWLVVDGRSLADRLRRNGAINRVGVLVSRLKKLLSGAKPQLLVVVTHHDEVKIDLSVLNQVKAEAMKHDADILVLEVAPFSTSEQVPPGYGLAALLDASLGPHPEPQTFWPSSPPLTDARSFLGYRKDP
jgi:Double-GTPase 2